MRDSRQTLHSQPSNCKPATVPFAVTVIVIPVRVLKAPSKAIVVPVLNNPLTDQAFL